MVINALNALSGVAEAGAMGATQAPPATSGMANDRTMINVVPPTFNLGAILNHAEGPTQNGGTGTTHSSRYMTGSGGAGTVSASEEGSNPNEPSLLSGLPIMLALGAGAGFLFLTRGKVF